MGIEPTQPAWKAGILPLNYTRTFSKSTLIIISDSHPKVKHYFELFFVSFVENLPLKTNSPTEERLCLRCFIQGACILYQLFSHLSTLFFINFYFSPRIPVKMKTYHEHTVKLFSGFKIT